MYLFLDQRLHWSEKETFSNLSNQSRVYSPLRMTLSILQACGPSSSGLPLAICLLSMPPSLHEKSHKEIPTETGSVNFFDNIDYEIFSPTKLFFMT